MPCSSQYSVIKIEEMQKRLLVVSFVSLLTTNPIILRGPAEL